LSLWSAIKMRIAGMKAEVESIKNFEKVDAE
jgi:hypothetical protein